MCSSVMSISGHFLFPSKRLQQLWMDNQDIPAALGFLSCLVLIDGLAEEVDAHFEARVPGIGEVLLEHGVQHQCAAAVAAVADADDDKADACLFDLRPVHIFLILGNIHAEGLALFQHAVRIEIIEFIVDALDGTLYYYEETGGY